MSVPTEEAFVAELKLVREAGVRHLRKLEVPALEDAARLAVADSTAAPYVVVEALLRRAVARLGGGPYGEAAAGLFGLDAGTRGLSSKLRREVAAEAFGRTYETFRKNYEASVLEEVVTQILILCGEQRTRDARVMSARAESLPDSAMPQVWLERFAAYYRIWSPISGLGDDLTAYRSTLLESARPWDRRFGSSGLDDPGYSQEEQAEGYATYALFHYAHFEWQLRQFQTLYGGQWLLSDAAAEQAVADAVYRIWWHSPWNERDRSFLRTLLAATREPELHDFITALTSTEIGRTTHDQWQDWVATCECAWGNYASAAEPYFPTRRKHLGIVEMCSVHQVIEACGDYLELIDEDWKKLADWYHLDNEARHGIRAEELYARYPKRACNGSDRS